MLTLGHAILAAFWFTVASSFIIPAMAPIACIALYIAIVVAAIHGLEYLVFYDEIKLWQSPMLSNVVSMFIFGYLHILLKRRIL